MTIVFVFVGAAKPAAMLAATLVVTLIGLFLRIVKALGVKNETSLLEQFPMVKKSDGIGVKLLAMYLAVEQDLLTVFVFESGFDVTATQVVAAIDAMNRAMKLLEASTVVALTDATTDAAMPKLRSWVGYAPLAATGSAEAAAASANGGAITASGRGKCVCRPHGKSCEAWVHCRACFGPLVGICSKQQGPLLLVKLQPAAAMTFCQT